MSLHPQDWPQFVPIKFQAANEPGARASFPSKRFPSQRHGRQFVVVHWLAVVVPRLWNVVAECANGQKVDFILLIATPTSGGAAVWWLQTWSKGGGGEGAVTFIGPRTFYYSMGISPVFRSFSSHATLFFLI